MKKTVLGTKQVETPESLMKKLALEVSQTEINIEDKKQLQEFATRVVVTKLDDKTVEGIYYAGSSSGMEVKSALDAAADIAGIQKIIHRTGRTLNLTHSEAPPPTPDIEGQNSLRWKSILVNELGN